MLGMIILGFIMILSIQDLGYNERVDQLRIENNLQNYAFQN